MDPIQSFFSISTNTEGPKKEQTDRRKVSQCLLYSFPLNSCQESYEWKGKNQSYIVYSPSFLSCFQRLPQLHIFLRKERTYRESKTGTPFVQASILLQQQQQRREEYIYIYIVYTIYYIYTGNLTDRRYWDRFCFILPKRGDPSNCLTQVVRVPCSVQSQ